MADQEVLEEQLREAGIKLSKLPSSTRELLFILDDIENCLLKVEQSPPQSMQNALAPALNALVDNELLKHSDTDVKVAIASCVSEITRITAPDAPYGDDHMKEIFKLIVSSFELLYDMSSPSYEKRVSILETVAKVRSCVVMLDLECDGLILEMFRHFLKAIRDNHPEKVFSSMETIMCLVLEESEEITADLLSPLLTIVKRDNQDVSPIARKLGEKVLEKCTSKLKPYMNKVLRDMGTSPNDYSKVVGIICEVTHAAVEQNDDIASEEHLAAESKSEEKVSSDKPSQVEEAMDPAASPGEVDTAVDQSMKNVTSNGDALMENAVSLGHTESPKRETEVSHHTVQSGDAEPDSLDSNVVQSETKLDHLTKRKRERKSKYSVPKAEASGPSPMDCDKETSDMPNQRKSHGKEADNIPDHETTPQVSSPSASKAASPPPTESVPDGIRAKRGRPARTKKGNITEDTDHDSRVPQSVRTKKGNAKEDTDNDLHGEPNESELPSSEANPPKRSVKKAPSAKGNEDDVTPTKDAGATSDSDKKPLKRSGKKMNVKVGDVDDVTPTKDAGATSDSETKPLKRSGKKVNVKAGDVDELSDKKQDSKGKKGKGTPRLKNDAPGESSDKKMPLSSKAAPKATLKNQKHLEEAPKTSSKRKRTTGKDEPSEAPSSVEEVYGEELVGCKIRVWWPDDEQFYEGVVDSFDPTEKKHKVLYVDGDEEILLLKDERIELVDPTQDGGGVDLLSPDASESRHKKAKTTSVSSSKHGKKGKGASTSKSKDEGTKSGVKTKGDNPNATGKAISDTQKSATKSKDDTTKPGSKDDTPKMSTKAKDEKPKTITKDVTPKTTTKSKGDSSKTGAKSKDDTPKTAVKSKGDTPKTGTKSKVETPKLGTKAKDETPKTSTKAKTETPKTSTKSDTPKTSTKSKSATSKSGSKPKANGTPAKGKSGTLNIEESEDSAKGKSSPSAAKTQESEPMGVNKRKRKAVVR